VCEREREEVLAMRERTGSNFFTRVFNIRDKTVEGRVEES
jgi:hypothetical protein